MRDDEASSRISVEERFMNERIRDFNTDTFRLREVERKTSAFRACDVTHASTWRLAESEFKQTNHVRR